MPIGPLKGYYLIPPSTADVQAHQAEVKAKTAALRPAVGRSKLERASPTISIFLRETTLSLQHICAALLARHKIKVSKSTLSRFIRSRPSLISLRSPKKTSKKTTSLE